MLLKYYCLWCGINNYMHIFSFNADLIKVKRSVYKDHDPAILDFSSWCIYYKVSGRKRLFLIQQWNKQNQKKHVEDDSKVRFFSSQLDHLSSATYREERCSVARVQQRINLVLKKICTVYRVKMSMKNKVCYIRNLLVVFELPVMNYFK